MNIKNKVRKDKMLNTYEYFLVCGKCGATTSIIIPERQQITLSRMICKCETKPPEAPKVEKKVEKEVILTPKDQIVKPRKIVVAKKIIPPIRRPKK